MSAGVKGIGTVLRALSLYALLAAIGANAATLSEAPASVPRGGSVTATWSGIATPTGTDWIGFYTPGAPNTSYASFRYTTGAASGSVPFTVPSTVAGGTYELRLFANNGYTLLATSNSFTVVLPSLTESPASASAGTAVTASWSNVGAPSATDWIGLYTPTAADTAYVSFQYTTGTGSGQMSFNIPATTAAGTYQLRLFSNNGYTRLATSGTFAVGSWILSGTVTSGASALPGVAFAAGAGTTCTSSDASGQYTCAVPRGWSGTVTPTLGGYVFSPASRTYANVSADQVAQDFTATATYQLTGQVTRNGSPVAGVAFAATGGSTCTSSNASGGYACTVPQGWSGTVTPSLSGYAFSPASRSYTSVAASQSAQDFIATALYQIGGAVTVSGSPLSGVALSGAGATCTSSDASGQYTCTILSGWSGTITPSLGGYTFTPISHNYVDVISNLTGQDFAAMAVTASNRIFFVHVDHLDTPRLISDSTGTAVWRWDQQEPFGVSPADENPSGLGVFKSPLRHPGQYDDSETGLSYNYFRDCYDPATGRYCQFDPIGLRGGINGYLYVEASPLLLTDPRGLQPVVPVNPGLLFPPAGGGVPSPLGKPKDDGSMGGLFPPGTFSQSEGGGKDDPTPQSIIQGAKVPPYPGLTNLAECTKGSTMVEAATDKRWKNGGVSIQQEYFCACGQITRHTIIFNGAVVHDHFRPGPPRPGGD